MTHRQLVDDSRCATQSTTPKSALVLSESRTESQHTSDFVVLCVVVCLFYYSIDV